MKRYIYVFLLICVLSLSAFSSSCAAKKSKFTSYSLDCFDTVTTITGYESSAEEFDRISGQILALLEEFHKLYTIYDRYDGLENLCTVNELRDGVHPKVKVDRRITDMLLFAKEMYIQTDGKLNIAMGSVLSVWHEYRSAGINDPHTASLPPTELLQNAALHTDIDNLIIDEESSTVWLSDPEMKLDVGAVAKGYAVEMIARELESQGITGYVINVGGNIRTIGDKPDGEPWTVGIENPDRESSEAYVAYLELKGESVVTSGSYQRFYTVDGKNYHHIIDTETLMPADRYLSVSVITQSSALADALSTALFCMPFEQGYALAESLPDTEVLWINADGSRFSSSSFEKYTAGRAK